MTITLSKEDTLTVLWEFKRQNTKRFEFSTKYKWKCLNCLTTIYVSYRQFGINAIFCPACYTLKSNKPTIVQYQYMRILKERQIELIEQFLETNPSKLLLDALSE